MKKSKNKREERGVVLDYLRTGYVNSRREDPVLQVLGDTSYTLLELIPKQDEEFDLLETVYIGNEDRPKIEHVKRKLDYDDLTSTAKGELKHAVQQIVEKREDEYVEFFNKAPPLSTRTHMLTLLPGVGKKHMQKIVEERRIEPFESYEDIEKRVSALKNPSQTVAKRIISEIEGNEKHILFAKK